MSPPPLREGDVVWARQKGYPWWPAVLSPAPASPGLGLWQTGQGKKTKYHCTFLAWNKERCWLEGALVRRFEREDVGEKRRKEYRVKLKHFKDSHLEAIDLGLEILDDPGNPMDHLVKEMEVVVEEDQEVGTEDLKNEKSKTAVTVERTNPQTGAEEIQGKSSKILAKKEKLAGVNKEATTKNVNARLEVENIVKANEETEESFFQTIAEKVKNPRNRKSVEKFNNPDENNEGKIGKIKKFLSKQQPPVLSSSSAPLKSPMRCQCAGCLLADCGQCRFCLDRVCFGGEGKLRQICSRKMCVASGKGGGVGMVGWNVDVGPRAIATTENDKDEKNYVFEDQEMKIANKERKARIIDIQSEAESGDDETPLVINFDNVADDPNNANASNQDPRDLPSPTHDELPTSSSISYSKSVDEKLVASDNSVWDDVKHSLLDVEDSLLMEVSDSLANEFEVSTHPPVLHSSPSSHHSQASSSITISTPSQSPVRDLCFANEAEEIVEGTGVDKHNFDNVVEPKFVDKSRSEPIATVENVYFHEDELEGIIDDNLIKEDRKVCVKVIKNDLESKVDHEEIEVTTSLKSKASKHKDKREHESKSQHRSKKKSAKVSSIIDDTIVVPKEVADIEASKSKESLKKVTEINMFTGNEIKKSEIKKARNHKNVRSKMRSPVVKDKDMKKEFEHSKVGSAARAPKEKREAKDFQARDANSNHTSEKSKHKGKTESSVLASGLRLPVKESRQVVDGERLPLKNKKQVIHHRTSESKFEDVLKEKKVSEVKTKKKDVKAKKVIKLKKEDCEIDSTRNEAKGTPHEASKLLGSFKIPKSIPKTKEVKKEEDVSVPLKKEKSCQDSISTKKFEKRRDKEKLDRMNQKDAMKKRVGSPARKVTRYGEKVDSSKEASEMAIDNSAVNWVAAVDWSNQVAPDSTTMGDEPPKYVDDNLPERNKLDDDSECSSGSRDEEDSSWKRKRGKKSDKELGSHKKVKIWMNQQKFSSEPSCCEPVESTHTNPQSLASYTMSLKLLEKLGPRMLFDSHCHLDFILFWRLPHMELESFDQFLHNFPLMNHPSLEGFITNFCSPRVWVEHLAPPTPLIQSLLSRPSVYYTIGCHPHYARELLNSRNYRLMEQLLEKAGPGCVAVGECGLDTSGKNTTRMADQEEVFKMQVKLAMRLKKPLVLHIRDAEKEAIRVLEEVKLPASWPIHRHCWNDTWARCQVWLDKFPSSVVGITNMVTIPRTTDLQQVAKMLPLDRLVLETDAPYFLPRGGGLGGDLGHTTRDFSLPVHVANVAAQVAAIRGCRVEEVLRASRKNIARVYRI
eukprot:GFUD01026278.1.p1 GENE.GFUD01026278.1~~GFUD01026278.1.p1  ORF type:complete len:1310 (+),score=409.24 GFUD01026278.1:104-4033(+)